ncbi:MAG: alpha/beta fold hydrolase [Anaerolineales bacterium]
MRAQLPGLVLAYDSAGSGQTLLLLHGYPLSRRLWRPQLEYLTDAAHVIAPDLRGHGDSDAREGPYTMDQLADDAVALLDSLGLSQPAVVAGLSMGGYVALALCRRHPSRVAGLILAATKAGADSPEAQANREKSAALAREKGVEAIADSMLPKMFAPATYTANPGLVAEARAMMAATPLNGVVGDLLGMKVRPDSTALLAQITIPVLVIHGQEDQLIPAREAEATHAGLPNARLALVPNAGHLLNLEQPEAFNAEVRTFLQSLSA